MSKLSNLLKILFIRDTWNIGYRFSERELLPFCSEPAFDIVRSNMRWWYADPFCVKHNNKYFIFCEMLDGLSGIGSIGVIDLNSDGRNKVRQIIKEPFHMSYPYVFLHKGTFYMIPETKQAKQIRLYKAIVFPHEWVLDKVLAVNVAIVDSTMLDVDNKRYIVAYEVSEKVKKLLIYEFDIDKKELIKTDYILPDNANDRRPAGSFIEAGTGFIRPGQYNANYYGEKIMLYKINNKPGISYDETLVGEILPSQIAASDGRKYRGIHTINKQEDIEVVDLLYSSFSIMKPFFMLVRLIRKITRKQV